MPVLAKWKLHTTFPQWVWAHTECTIYFYIICYLNDLGGMFTSALYISVNEWCLLLYIYCIRYRPLCCTTICIILYILTIIYYIKFVYYVMHTACARYLTISGTPLHAIFRTDRTIHHLLHLQRCIEHWHWGRCKWRRACSLHTYYNKYINNNATVPYFVII